MSENLSDFCHRHLLVGDLTEHEVSQTNFAGKWNIHIYVIYIYVFCSPIYII